MRPDRDHHPRADRRGGDSGADHIGGARGDQNHTQYQKKLPAAPEKDTENARFFSQSDNYGIWLCRDTAAAVMELLTQVRQSGDAVEDLRVERPSLEERFLELVEGQSPANER